MKKQYYTKSPYGKIDRIQSYRYVHTPLFTYCEITKRKKDYCLGSEAELWEFDPATVTLRQIQ